MSNLQSVAVCVAVVAFYIVITITFTSTFKKSAFLPIYSLGKQKTPKRNSSHCNHTTPAITKDILLKLRKTATSFRNMPLSAMKDYSEPQMDLSKVTYRRPTGTSLTADDIIAETCDQDNPVPDLIHYILPFYDARLQFHHFVCILSGFHIAKPKRVMFWYSKEPQGQYWEQLKKNITAPVWNKMVIMAHRVPPQQIYGRHVKVKEHQADVIRMEAVIHFGGIYLDLDVIVLKSLLPLRKFPMTIGRETQGGLCNGVFLASRENFFLKMWHLTYQLFKDFEWQVHSVLIPDRLNIAFPGNCHVEEEGLDRPNWTGHELQLIYSPNRSWDWKKKNYAMHLWYSKHGVQYNMDTIKKVDSTLGDMFRFVLYGRTQKY